MKQLRFLFRTYGLIVCCLLFSSFAKAEKMDSVEIGLITCFPHEEVYSLYGHTALRYHNLRTGEDLVFNYGVFNFKAPHFVARFVLGKTDYELGIIPFKPFCKYYKDWGSEVIEQLLNLTNEEKARISYALAVNYRPENRVYRYNFFYDNCSTRPRDIIANNILGRVIYAPHKDYTPSYREMIHELVGHHPWATFGNDLLLGAKSDVKASLEQQQFLPLNLMHDFDNAQIYTINGEYKPLVKERRVLVESGVQIIENDFPLSPTACSLLLLSVFIGVFLIERKRKQQCVWFDIIFMTLTGTLGLLLFVMLFSEHPTTSTNLQILVFNPLTLFFIPSVWRRSETTHYWTFLLICVVLFFLGCFLQDYAEGMEIVALCLLTRYCSHLLNNKKVTNASVSK